MSYILSSLWCAGMMVVPKKYGKVWICIDLKPLNTSVKCETHPLPKVDDTLAQLSGAKVFSKLDALADSTSRKNLATSTTFIIPFGRFCLSKMLFGICSVPKNYQCTTNKVLTGLPGVLCLIDGILVYGSSIQKHNHRLEATLKRISSPGITLNKCNVSLVKKQSNFLVMRLTALVSLQIQKR